VAEKGVKVVTLHQGIPGIINGSMMNPYINYPFLPSTVELLHNYTSQSAALGMATKFYYTVRELSNHAAELFALISLQGEVIVDTDPTTIPQPGYCHDVDCHGGGTYLHEHVITNYSECWQQSLPNGEIDASVCDSGNSRWMNYYIEGLHWSVAKAPFISGCYYDGLNFDRRTMRRIRKALNNAHKTVAAHEGTSAASKPLIDLHSGRVSSSPSAISYLSHYAYVDSVWNGEGFDFSQDEAYWLVEVSGTPQGLSGDRLGGALPTTDFKGMLWGMTARNRPSAPALWKFWDEYGVSSAQSSRVGWWEDDAPVRAVVVPTPPTPVPVLPKGTWVISDKIWNDQDCVDVGNTKLPSAEACKAACIANSECTAFNFNLAGLGCALRQCSRFAQRHPSWALAGYKGYTFEPDYGAAAAIVYSKYAKVWDDDKCFPIKTIPATNATSCEGACDSSVGCTAFEFDFNGGSGCILRACNGFHGLTSTVPPTVLRQGWFGYAVVATVAQSTDGASSERAGAAMGREATEEDVEAVEVAEEAVEVAEEVCPRAGTHSASARPEHQDACHAASATSSNSDCAVLATTYLEFRKQAVVAIASWCATDVRVQLDIDWAELGLNASSTKAVAPPIAGVQKGSSLYNATTPFVLGPNGGAIFVLSPS
jgi:hypothetical protein